MMESNSFNFNLEGSMNAAMLPESSTISSSTPVAKQVAPVSFGDGYVPIPVDTVLKPACVVSKVLSFGDLYSSLVCINHKDNVTTVSVCTGQAFFKSSERYVEGVADFRVYVPIDSLLKTISLAGTHLGFSANDISLGFWDLLVPNNNVTDSDDLKKHFASADLANDFAFIDIDFPFSSLPSNIVGLYSSALVTIQNEGIVWYSSENKHYVASTFPYNIALHLTTAQVLRQQKFKKVYLDGEKLHLKTDTFSLCVPTFKIEQDLFKTTFSIPLIGDYSPIAPIQLSTMMRSADLFSGSVKFRFFCDGSNANITAMSDERVLFSVPLLMGDMTHSFDYSVTSDAVLNIPIISSLGQNFLSSSTGVCVFFS